MLIYCETLIPQINWPDHGTFQAFIWLQFTTAKDTQSTIYILKCHTSGFAQRVKCFPYVEFMWPSYLKAPALQTVIHPCKYQGVIEGKLQNWRNTGKRFGTALLRTTSGSWEGWGISNSSCGIVYSWQVEAH